MKLFLVATALFVLAGCTSGATAAGVKFDDEGLADVACMKHQPAPPAADYTDEDGGPTDEVLPVLRYYTAHGKKAFCDGTGPNEADKAWAAVYVDLGADKANVAKLLG
ncbi:hypothetical protein ACFFQW_21155 [Umezawaea endophytica]|uniref:Lipoprotein n=1 Tax=Umezawaea endophytica TaxID=1654476 RepID=A0A9X2VPX9_9PSEU|nr:hypothetical protein [Umezawaea endophytica]MCS7480545.1 hypothetical protein [Umezawaea endophytica]